MAQSPSIQSLLDQSGWIQKLAARLVGDPHLAEDLAQDTWVSALEHQPDPGRPLGAWVTTVLRNNLARLRRRDSNREQREQVVGSSEALPSTLDVVEKAATHRNLVEAVLGLDEPYRTTILLRFFEQSSYRDIARQTNVTTATVNSRVTRGLERLRRRLDQEYGGDRRAWAALLLPLAEKSSALSLSIPGVSMSTTLTIGFVSFAAATTLVVLDPIGEPATSPSLAAAASVVEPVQNDPQLLPVLLPEERAPAEALDVSPRSPLLVQDEGKQKKVRQEWTADFDHSIATLGTTESVMLDTGAGDIEVVAGLNGNVSFTAKVVADLERVDQSALTYVLEDHVTITEEEGTLKIEDAHGRRNDRGWQVNFVLQLPPGMKLHANTGSGDVKISEAQSDLMVNTGSGDVIISSPRTLVSGKLMANTGSGDVHIDVGGVSRSLAGNTGSGDVDARIRNYDFTGKVSLNSGSGDLSLMVPPGLSGDFDLETSSGSVEVPNGFGLIVEKAHGMTYARGVVGSGGGTYKLSSGSGNLRVHTDDATSVGQR